MKRFIAILQTDLDRAGAVGDGLLLGFLGVLAVSCLPLLRSLLILAWSQAAALLG